jgi:adenylate cyclase
MEEKTKKDKKITAKIRNIIILLFIFLILAICYNLGLFYKTDASISDSLYQESMATDGEVVLVNIDSAALNELGNLPWSRDVYADIIEALNADPEARPAAIALDVVFAGYSGNDYADDRLLKACADGGNVVLAGDAIFGSQLVSGDEGFYMDDDAVLGWDEPFPELKEVTRVGHINAFYDTDGTIRHMRQYVKVNEGQPDEAVYQIFAREIYEQYCESLGIEPAPQPTRRGDAPYIKYSGKPGDFSESISALDIITGDVPGDYFEDRIVIIGPYDATLQDNYQTAITHDENMFGVEIQANIVQAYINDEWPTEMTDKATKALVLIIAAVCAVAFALTGLKFTIIGWIVFAPGWVILCKVMSGRGYLMHPFYIPIIVTVLAIVAIALHYITAAIEKRRVTQVFSRYVAPGVVTELLKEDESALGLGGKNVDIAVLFVDIRGFTTMSESMAPEQVVAILNDYLQLTTDCVMQNEGTLDKFVGDCTMAFWNAPLAQDDYVYKACRAAMDMVEGSIPLTAELERKFGKRVGFGIGVHCGPAVVGNIGAKQRMDFTAIGDTVNTSSRLESNAPSSTIYISRAVADILGDRAETTSLGGSIKLKGKTEGFEVLTLDKLY